MFGQTFSTTLFKREYKENLAFVQSKNKNQS